MRLDRSSAGGTTGIARNALTGCGERRRLGEALADAAAHGSSPTLPT